jgi:hypothetical protein
LQRVARRPVVHHPAGVDVLLHAGHDQTHAVTGDEFIAGGDHLVEVVSGVDVHHRERQPAGRERLDCQVQHDDRVLAAGEQQHRPLEFRGDLTDDVDRLGFQRAQLAELVATGRRHLGHGVDHRFLVKLVGLTGFTALRRR